MDFFPLPNSTNFRHWADFPQVRDAFEDPALTGTDGPCAGVALAADLQGELEVRPCFSFYLPEFHNAIV